MLRRNKVKVAFFTARQSAEYFKKHLAMDAIWLPEACNADLYRPENRCTNDPSISSNWEENTTPATTRSRRASNN